MILAEFGNDRHPNYPDQDTHPATPGPTTWDGPLHNAIPEPDRTVDNSTNWDAELQPRLLPEPLLRRRRHRRLRRRAGDRQAVVRAPELGPLQHRRSGVRLGQGALQRGALRPVQRLPVLWQRVHQHVGPRPRRREPVGRSTRRPTARATPRSRPTLATYDQWDRYDADGDGNFNEPDGFIDHFQIVHSGGDQADGDPYQGEDAIWSHRGTRQVQQRWPRRSARRRPIADTGMWVGDYTDPARERRHVGLHPRVRPRPRSARPLRHRRPGQDNGVNWWSMMSQSRQAGPNDQSIGSRGSDFGAWEKLFLGWLDYKVVQPTAKGTKVMLGPHEYNTDKTQAVIVAAAEEDVVTTPLVTPHDGRRRTSTAVARTATAAHADPLRSRSPRGASTLSFQTNYAIEDCGCDYALRRGQRRLRLDRDPRQRDPARRGQRHHRLQQ